MGICKFLCCCCCCPDCSRKKKTLEEKLEKSRLYDLYMVCVDDPDGKSSDADFTNAQMALRLDIMSGKSVWTGNFWQDFKYFLGFNHPLCACFAANAVDAYTANERTAVLAMQICVNSMLTWMAILMQSNAETAKKAGDQQEADRNYKSAEVWKVLTPFVLALVVGILRGLATCSCVQGLNCGEWKFLCFSGPCFAKRIRGCIECIGAMAMTFFGIISVICFLFTLFYAHFELDDFPGYTGGFTTNMFSGWAIGVMSNFAIFYFWTYPGEKKYLEKERSRIEGVADGTYKQGCMSCKSKEKMMQETYKIDIWDLCVQDANRIVQQDQATGEDLVKVQLDFKDHDWKAILVNLLTFWSDSDDYTVTDLTDPEAVLAPETPVEPALREEQEEADPRRSSQATPAPAGDLEENVSSSSRQQLFAGDNVSSTRTTTREEPVVGDALDLDNDRQSDQAETEEAANPEEVVLTEAADPRRDSRRPQIY